MISGREIILENIRQKCVYSNTLIAETPDLFFNYITAVLELCFNNINSECSEEAHSIVGLSYKDTTKCMDDSFETISDERNDNENTLLSEELDYWH